MDGQSVADIFEGRRLGYTFDDFIVLPGFISKSPNEVNLETKLTRKLSLRVPFVSSPMDTITEWKMAGELGKLGGVGIIHANMDIPTQVEYVKRAREFGAPFVVCAVTTHDTDRKRIEELVKAKVDGILFDSSQGNSVYQINAIKNAKKNWGSNLEVIGGNVVTQDQAQNLITHAGVDGLRVGMSIGSVCSTAKVIGLGRSQGTAIYKVANIARQHNVPVIADGGINDTGHMFKALLLGASSVMMGKMFAGLDETPGETFYKDGVKLKVYRGMGSADAMKSRFASNVRYNAGYEGRKTEYNAGYEGRKTETEGRKTEESSDVKIIQGITGTVIAQGSVNRKIPFWSQSIKHSMCSVGVHSISEMHKSGLDDRTLRVELRSLPSITEGNIHGLHNYERD